MMLRITKIATAEVIVRDLSDGGPYLRPLFECFDHGLLFSFEGSVVLKASKHAKI